MTPLLSVLEATAIGPGVGARQALEWTEAIATAAERLGFHRLWVVEHHAIDDIGCTSPAVMIAHLAALTKRLRIGSGGVMLPNHSCLVVAEDFSLLQALHLGRIDLGVGRASGTDPEIARALQRNPADPESFCGQLDELCSFFNGDFPQGHAYENVKLPLRVEPPPIYLLGSSVESARLAASRGMPFVFASHLNPASATTALRAYRENFRSSQEHQLPYAIVTVSVICAQTHERAKHAAMSAAVVRLRRAASIRCGLRLSDEALTSSNWLEEEERLAERELSGGWIHYGDPGEISLALKRLQRTTGADELMLTSIEYDGSDRIQTLRLVSNAFALT